MIGIRWAGTCARRTITQGMDACANADAQWDADITAHRMQPQSIVVFALRSRGRLALASAATHA